jgi:hypothetical protein
VTSPPADRARRETVIAVVLGAIGVVLLLGAGLGMRGGAGSDYDLAAYLAAAARIIAEGTPYQPETLGGPFQPGPSGLYLYAPPLAVLMLPLADLPATSVSLGWLVLRVIVLAVGCAVMPVRAWVRGASLLVAGFSLPVLFDLNLGNVSVVIVALAAIAWRWLDRPAGSVAIALAILLRPTMALVPVWQALRRRWPPILWTLIALAVAVIVTLPFVGPAGYLDYLTVLANVTDTLGVPRNVDIGSALRLAGVAEPWTTIGFAAGVVVGIGVVIAAARRDPSAGYVAVVGASLLLAPLLWAHYLASLLVTGALLADRGRRWGLLLPLLGWLPEPLLPVAAVAGALLPFIVARAPDAPLAAAPATTLEGSTASAGGVQSDQVADLRP